MLRSIGKQSGEGRLRWEGFGKEVLSLESEWVMNGESGESIELIEKVPLKELGESQLWRLVRV